MNSADLPPRTVRDLGALMVYFAELAWHGSKAALRAFAPLVRPPDDMEVRTADGGLYTGAIVLEGNRVATGAVVRVGQDLPDAPVQDRNPWSSPNEDPPDELRHWAIDPRDAASDERGWRR